jgi:alanyl-tRNA synthetase
MQQHTAQHLLTSIGLARFGWSTRSFHIGPEVSDIELDCRPPTGKEIEALEDAVAEIAGEGRWIRCYRVSPDEYAKLEVRSRGLPAGHSGDIRLVEIEGVDRNTCGGTHVRSTAEVGAVKVVRSEPIRGGCRLHWVAGKRTRQRLAFHESRLSELRSLLDTADEGLVSVAQLKLEQIGEARRTIRQLEDRLAVTLAEKLLADSAAVTELHLEGSEATLLRRVAEIYAERSADGLALLTAEDDGGVLFAVAAGSTTRIDIQNVGREVARLLEGRGGGAGRVFQGKASSQERRAEALEYLQKTLVSPN